MTQQKKIRILKRDYQHPHHDARHVMVHYRKFIIGTKRKLGSARGLIKYPMLVEEYFAAKRKVCWIQKLVKVSAGLRS